MGHQWHAARHTRRRGPQGLLFNTIGPKPMLTIASLLGPERTCADHPAMSAFGHHENNSKGRLFDIFRASILSYTATAWS